MQNSDRITPRKLSGFMELMPEKQLIFDNMRERIQKVFAKNCFSPLDTPVLELANVLLAKSGGEIDKEIYHFYKGDTQLAMRYDLTVPLARFVAMNYDKLTFPFKRYQIGKVYRGEKAQKGRFREFYQCDADIIGNEQLPIVADAECINLIAETFKELNLDVEINISNRNILFGLIENLGYKNKTTEILTILDKLPKIGKEKASEWLKEIQLHYSAINLLIEVCNFNNDSDVVLRKIWNYAENETFKKGVSELKELFTYIKAYGIPNAKLNLGIIRGQNYYTGTIFETYMVGHPDFGAVCAGGRYDNLAEYYTDKKLPGVGMSIGLTRLFDQLDSHNMLGGRELNLTELEIIPLGDTIKHCLELSNYFKSQNISCEVNYDSRSFKSKLREADKKKIPYILVVGENEMATKTYSLKDMVKGTNFNKSKEDCVNTIKNKG